jgi:hypothetical protein
MNLAGQLVLLKTNLMKVMCVFIRKQKVFEDCYDTFKSLRMSIGAVYPWQN